MKMPVHISRLNIVIFLSSIVMTAQGITTDKSICLNRPCSLPDETTLNCSKVSGIEPGDKGENIIWDFSNATIINGNYKVIHRSIGDSILDVKYGFLARHDYFIRNDSVFLRGYEDRTVRITDSIAAPTLRYPVRYNDVVRGRYYFTGIMWNKYFIDAAGETCTHADGFGNVILPDGDTIPAIRISETFKSIIRLDDRRLSRPIDVVQDSILLHINQTYRWYSPDYAYPIAAVTVATLLDCDSTEISRSRLAYFCPPSEQPATAFNSPDKQKSPRQKNNASQNGHQKDSSIPLSEQIVAEISQDAITVSFFNSAKTNDEISIVLCDILGRVFFSHSTVGTSVPVNIDTASLPPNDYVLYVSCGDENFSQKFTLKK